MIFWENGPVYETTIKPINNIDDGKENIPRQGC